MRTDSNHLTRRSLIGLLVAAGATMAVGIPAASAAGSTGITAADVDSFVAKWTGIPVNANLTCVGLFKQYHQELVGGGTYSINVARDLWYAPMPEYDKIPFGSAPPIKGDVVVWSLTPGGNDPAGHVAIFISDNGNEMKVFSQNNGPYGFNPAAISLTKANVLGFLRPKNSVRYTADQQFLIDLFGAL